MLVSDPQPQKPSSVSDKAVLITSVDMTDATLNTNSRKRDRKYERKDKLKTNNKVSLFDYFTKFCELHSLSILFFQLALCVMNMSPQSARYIIFLAATYFRILIIF